MFRDILKEYEDDAVVQYRYGPIDGELTGVMIINKKMSTVSSIKLMPEETEAEFKLFVMMAASPLADEEFPEKFVLRVT